MNPMETVVAAFVRLAFPIWFAIYLVQFAFRIGRKRKRDRHVAPPSPSPPVPSVPDTAHRRPAHAPFCSALAKVRVRVLFCKDKRSKPYSCNARQARRLTWSHQRQNDLRFAPGDDARLARELGGNKGTWGILSRDVGVIVLNLSLASAGCSAARAWISSPKITRRRPLLTSRVSTW